MKALVIPSNRENCLADFLAAWEKSGQADWDCVILSEDSDERRMKPRSPWPLHHFSHAEVRQRLGKDAWIISRGDSARRCFGFLIARELGAEWVLTLDDDCFPRSGCGVSPQASARAHCGETPLPGICAGHLAALSSHTVCQPTAGMRTRGLPYRDVGRIQPALNMGLWCNVPDLDGPQGLTQQPYFTPPAGSTLANPWQRYPLCGMNLFFHVDMVPGLYFPLMGEGQPYRRFDDIWAGWIFQKVAEHCRISWSFGEPWIEHIRASDPFANLVKEAPGIAVNESFWQAVNEVKLRPSDPAGAVGELGAAFRENRDPYFAQLGEALEAWARLTATA